MTTWAILLTAGGVTAIGALLGRHFFNTKEYPLMPAQMEGLIQQLNTERLLWDVAILIGFVLCGVGLFLCFI